MNTLSAVRDGLPLCDTKSGRAQFTSGGVIEVSTRDCQELISTARPAAAFLSRKAARGD